MALQHLRASTANKRPTPGSMSDGQLAMNTNLASPGLFFKDSNGDLVKVGPVHVGSTAPNVSPAVGGQSGNSKGEQWLDTSGTNPVLKIWDGSAWQSEAGEFVNASGDVMTGALGIIAGTAAAPGLYVSGDTNTGIYSPGADQVAISTNGTGRLFVDGSGRVGANTSTFGDARDSLIVSPASGQTTTFATIKTGSTSANSSLFFGDTDSNSVGGITYEHSTDAFAFRTNGSERARLDSSGRLGLGTSSPNAPLMVQGSSQSVIRAYTTDTGTSNQILFDNGSNYHYGAVGTVSGNTTTTGDVFGLGYTGSNTTDFTPVLSWTANTGRVGIGTTSPSQALHVVSASTQGLFEGSAQGNIIIQKAGTSGFAIGSDAAGTLNFYDNNASSFRLKIDSSGRLLVGTSTARSNFYNSAVSAGFQLEGTGTNRRAAVIGDDFEGVLILASQKSGAVGGNTVLASGDPIGAVTFQGSDGTEFAEAASITAYVDGTPGANDMPGRLVFSTTADGASSPTERMRIDNSGLVGIGTTSPISNLHVSASSGESVIRVANTGANSAWIAFSPGSTGSAYIHNEGNTATIFTTNGTERMRIDNLGQININGVYSAGSNRIRLGPTTSNFSRDTTSFASHIYFENPNGTVGQISTNGSATSFTTSSDYRLKENVAEVTDSIARLKQLKACRFNFIVDPDKTVDGFIAHEVQEVVPEAITGTKDEEDADGNPIYQGIDQSKLVPLLTAALQEAIAKIETLEAKVIALESN